MTKETFTFYTDTIEVKELEGHHYIEGYISTSGLDRVGDIVTPEALADMVAQIKSRNIKIDVEHEAWRQSSNIIPVGRIIDAGLDDKGIWVKAILNSGVSRFEEVLSSIKNGFLDAFSIAYKAVDFIHRKVGDKMVRMLHKVELLNVSLTGIPANPDCRITGVMMKTLEVETMTEEEISLKELREEVASLKSLIEASKTESEQRFSEMKTGREASDAVVAELKAKLSAAETVLSSPQLKGLVEVKPDEEPVVAKSPLQMIR